MVVKGRKLTIKEQWQKLKNELKDMTPKQKLEHLWEYYKWVLGVLFIAVFIICVVIASIISRNTETILAGAIVNVPVNMEGYVNLQSGYYHYAKTEGRQAVRLTNFTLKSPYSTVEKAYTWDVIDGVTAMISSDNLDYIMYDELAATFFMSPDYFADLRELFSEEELTAMGNSVVNLKIEETGEQIPVAIDIRDTEFFEFYMVEDKPIYLSFSARLPRKDACKDFWYYIKGGETKLLQTEFAGFAVDMPWKDGTAEELKDAFFAAQGYQTGDQRVELISKSFQPILDEEGQDLAAAVRGSVLEMLRSGSADYVLCGADALAQLDKGDLLDMKQVLPETQMQDLEDALVIENGVAVAVDVSALPWFADKTEEPVYLAFSAKTEKLQVCKDLWNMISKK